MSTLIFLVFFPVSSSNYFDPCCRAVITSLHCQATHATMLLPPTTSPMQIRNTAPLPLILSNGNSAARANASTSDHDATLYFNHHSSISICTSCHFLCLVSLIPPSFLCFHLLHHRPYNVLENVIQRAVLVLVHQRPCIVLCRLSRRCDIPSINHCPYGIIRPLTLLY